MRLEQVITGLIENSVIAGAFIYLLHNYTTSFKLSLNDVSNTLTSISQTMNRMDMRMEQVEKRIERLEER